MSLGVPVSGDAAFGVVVGAHCSYVSILLRARMNILCNSGGRSSGNSGSCSVGLVGVGSVSFATGVLDVSFVSKGNFMFGFGIVISGFLLRMINVVVAIYSGSADSISRPNAKPAIPCNCACASLCHCAPLKMLKLKRKYNTAHIMNM